MFCEQKTSGTSSWDDYTEAMAQRNMEECAIYGCRGEKWTERCQQGCSQDEVCKMSEAIDKDDEKMKMNGMRAFGKDWKYIRQMDSETVLFKGKGEESKKSLVVAKSKQAVIMACCSEEKLPASAVVKETAGMRDYLKGCGY